MALRGTSLVRLRIGLLLIAMIVSVFAARLFQLQGVDAAVYVAKAEAQGYAERAIKLEWDRRGRSGPPPSRGHRVVGTRAPPARELQSRRALPKCPPRGTGSGPFRLPPGMDA